MSFQIKLGNKSLKDTFYTLAPLNSVLRIFLLSTVKRVHNKVVQCWSLTENLIVLSVMLIINVFCFVNKLQRIEHHKDNELKFTDTVQFMYLLGFAEYIVDLFCVYKMKHSCVEYLQFYVNIDQLLTVPNFPRMRRRNLITVVCLTSFAISSVMDYSAWFLGFGWIPPTFYCLEYIYIFINALTALDFTSHVMQIECRLQVMLNLLEDYASSLPSHDEIMHTNFETVESLMVNRLRTVSDNKSLSDVPLQKCYVYLIEQVNYINTAFGIRLGAFCLIILIYLVHMTNIIIRILHGRYLSPYAMYKMPAFTTAVRITNYGGVLLAVVYRCEQTYKISDNIIRLIDLAVFSKNIPTDMRSSLVELRTLMLSRPIKFHGAKCFTLNYPLLVSVASVVVTYTIILLQNMQ